MEQSSYKTIRRQSECEFVERRSRFLGAVCPIISQQDAQMFIDERRKKHWNAAHNVYAYVLREGQAQRYSDDGEPQGTAGYPILDVLLREELTNCIIVVTRYFGGVLLGTGGLVRAYSRTAKLAIEAGGVSTMSLCTRAVVACGYALYGPIDAAITNSEGIVEDTRYTNNVEIEFLAPYGVMGRIRSKITELSAGSVDIKEIGQEYTALD